jgi:hypothetical protein
LRDRLRANSHPTEQALEIMLPLRLWIQADKDSRLLFQADRSQWSQNPIFENRPEAFRHWMAPLEGSHGRHSSEAPFS